MSAAILTIALVALFGVGAYALKISSSLQKTELANDLVQETIEAIRAFRSGTTWASNGLGVITTGNDNPYYPKLDTGTNPPKWTLAAGTQSINGFTRKVIFDNVSRDPTTGNIESTYNASHNDPDTKKATVTVSWANGNIQIITYFTNWKQ